MSDAIAGAPRAQLTDPTPGPPGPPGPTPPAADPVADAAGIERTEGVGGDGDADAVDLPRIAWSVTALVFLVAGLILLVDDYLGYGAVTVAVALAAGINLV